MEQMGRRPKSQVHHSPKALQVLKTLGLHIQVARKRRKISIRDMAQRMMASPTTVLKLEAGYPGVSLGAMAAALMVLGLHRRIETLIAPESDAQGLAEEQKKLPKRIRTAKYDF